MRVQLSHPELLDELIAQLRGFGLAVERETDDSARVTMPPPADDEPDNPPDQDEIELTFLVRMWQQRHPHTFVAVEPKRRG